jgi:hypothetical protein
VKHQTLAAITHLLVFHFMKQTNENCAYVLYSSFFLNWDRKLLCPV